MAESLNVVLRPLLDESLRKNCEIAAALSRRGIDMGSKRFRVGYSCEL